jgi:DNA-binding NarL/FixJ family response regulator
MQGDTGDGSLLVCIIEQNPLALEFLSGILQKDTSIRVVRIEGLSTRTDEESAATIFIVDNCGLPLPMSECLRRLQSQHPGAKYVVVDRDLAKEALFRLLRLKIDGYLPYGEVSQNLLPAIHSVALGKIWITREILREYVHSAQEAHLRDSSPLESMTTRETQILELVNRRLTNKEIADILHVQESTVKFHLSNIYSKLQVSSRYELIRDGSDLPAFLDQQK